MQEGILESIIENFKKKVEMNDGFVEIDYIVDFIRDLQNHEYDAHVVIMGQNGNGKSMLMLELMKRLDANSIRENIIYPFNTIQDLIKKIEKSKKSVIGIDELKRFFHYKMHMTLEQIVLTNLIEYARSNCTAFVGCCNDIRRINSNYRNSKVQMVIWLLDRYENGDIKSYGLVFIGNPALEEEDKFMLNNFQNVYSFEQIRLIAESLQTFVGYLLVEDISYVLTQEELQMYKERKQRGIEEEAQKYIQRLKAKESEEKKIATLEDAKTYSQEILENALEEFGGVETITDIHRLREFRDYITRKEKEDYVLNTNAKAKKIFKIEKEKFIKGIYEKMKKIRLNC